MAGEIVHLELPSRNFERSAAFYGKLFGWRAGPAQSGGHLRFETSPGGEGETGGGEGGGPQVSGSFILSALAQSPGPLPFIGVDDVDGTLAEAVEQGGRILVPRTQLAGQGDFGILADLDGNVIAVLARAGTPASRRPATATAAVSAVGSAAATATAGSSEAAAAPAATSKAATAKDRPRDIAKEKPGDSSKKSAPAARANAAKGPPKAGPARKR